jgi:hypothetical protein
MKHSQFYWELKIERDFSEIRNLASENIQKLQNYNQTVHDKNKKEARKYRENYFVMIMNTDVTPGVNKKCIPKFRGPYIVKKVLPNDRYLIEDIDGFQHTQIPFKSVYDASRIKPWLSTSNSFNSTVDLDVTSDP